MALREIAAHFGFSVDKSKLVEADKAVGGVKHHAEESAQGVGLLVEAFGALAGLELVRMTKDFVAELATAGDELADTAEATGLSTRELQIWQFGAAKSGESAEVFTLALRKMATAVAGGNDEVGTQAKLFADMGIATKDAHKQVRPLADILPEVADHFKGMADGAAKSALAQQLFGRSGTKLIPLLNQGSAGVHELAKEFDALGGGFDTETIERAGEMKEAIARVNLQFTSLKSQLALAILPRFQTLLGYLENAAGFMTDLAKDTTLAESAVGSLSTALALTLGAALLPYIGGALKFAAIYLAVDDLKGFLEGQDSEIGSILDGWFGDGTADVVREWCLDAGASFLNFVSDFRAVIGLAGLDFTIFVDRNMAAWTSSVLSMQKTWNSFIESLGLNDRFKIDTTARAADFQSQKERIGGLNYMRNEAADKLTKYASDTTPTSGGKGASALQQQVVAPFSTAATQAPQQSWNMVQSAPQITINVPAGTPQAQTEAIGRQARAALRDSHRQALQTLENRGGS